MFFTDTAFFIFLPIVVILYWLLPFKGQNLLLLCASYLFYGWVEPWTVWILLGVALVNWKAALLIEKYPKKRKTWLILCCLVSLSILGWFKYAMFVMRNLELLIPSLHTTLLIFLPAGISFFTFQGLAYTIDVYWGKISAEKNFFNFALFKGFFPQLVAGPIERASNLLTQVNNPRHFDSSKFWSGIDLLLRGYVKKVVIADNVATYVNMIFDLKEPSALTILIGGIGFSIQILADFSAYTDIARGCARLLGFELMENFNHPYISRNPSEFWRRWHISLSNCIRDYLYLPLGGSRVTTGRWLFNIFIVWFLCGLWHGAGWNFIAWGLYWGAMLVVYRILPSLPQNNLWDIIRIPGMFVVIIFGWILFRARDLTLLPVYFSSNAFDLIPNQLAVNFAVIGIFLMYASPLLVAFALEPLVKQLSIKTQYMWPIRISAYTAALLLILVYSAEQGADFYYFQF